MRERRFPVQVRMLWDCWECWEGLVTFLLCGWVVHPGVCLQPGGMAGTVPSGTPLSVSSV